MFNFPWLTPFLRFQCLWKKPLSYAAPTAAWGVLAGLARRDAAPRGMATGSSRWAGQGDSFAFPPMVISMSHILLSSPKYGKVTSKSLRCCYQMFNEKEKSPFIWSLKKCVFSLSILLLLLWFIRIQEVGWGEGRLQARQRTIKAALHCCSEAVTQAADPWKERSSSCPKARTPLLNKTGVLVNWVFFSSVFIRKNTVRMFSWLETG